MVGSGHSKVRFCTKAGETTPVNSDGLKSYTLTRGEPCESINISSSEKDQKLRAPIVDTSISSISTCEVIVQNKIARGNMSMTIKEHEFNIYYQILQYKDVKKGKFRGISEFIFHENTLIQAYREASKAKGSITEGGDDDNIEYMTESRLKALSKNLLEEK